LRGDVDWASSLLGIQLTRSTWDQQLDYPIFSDSGWDSECGSNYYHHNYNFNDNDNDNDNDNHHYVHDDNNNFNHNINYIDHVDINDIDKCSEFGADFKFGCW
jgi:hypothetical protein